MMKYKVTISQGRTRTSTVFETERSAMQIFESTLAGLIAGMDFESTQEIEIDVSLAGESPVQLLHFYAAPWDIRFAATQISREGSQACYSYEGSRPAELVGDWRRKGKPGKDFNDWIQREAAQSQFEIAHDL